MPPPRTAPMQARHLPLHLAWLAPLHAAEPAGRWFDHAVERSWVENYDPTLITRRVLTELNFDSKLTAGLAWHF